MVQSIWKKIQNPKLDDMLDSVMAEEKEVLLLGDLNCNYLVQNDHKALKQIMRYNGLKQMVKNPTRIMQELKIQKPPLILFSVPIQTE